MASKVVILDSLCKNIIWKLISSSCIFITRKPARKQKNDKMLVLTPFYLVYFTRVNAFKNSTSVTSQKGQRLLAPFWYTGGVTIHERSR